MLFVLVLPAILIFANLILKKQAGEFIAELDKKENKFSLFYPLGFFIYKLTEKGEKRLKEARNKLLDREVLIRLNANGDIEKICMEHMCRVLSLIQLGLVMICALVGVSRLAYSDPLEEGSRIKRPESGTVNYEIIASLPEGDEENVKVTVSEKKPDAEGLDKMFEEAYKVLERTVLADNESGEHVTQRLNLISQIPGTSIEVGWPLLDYEYIYSDGTIRADRLTAPVIVDMTAELTYLDERRFYMFPLRLVPLEEDERSSLIGAINQELADIDRESIENQYFILPSNVNGKAISWRTSGSNYSQSILILGIIALAAVIPGVKVDLKRKEKEREEKLLKEYPNMISKFVLLINAGMTCRAAWDKMCSDYLVKKCSQKAESVNFSAEEMLLSEKELRFGASEAAVYESFGKRIGLLPYRRFGNMLSKNLKRGSKDLVYMLEQEADEAFAKRREGVKQSAEEAGTKLLIPMMGMLCIVIAIVVIPAFMGTSF